MITIIAGTNNAESRTSHFAQVYADEIQSRGEACQVADLRDLPSDFISNTMYHQRSEAFERWQQQYLISVDKIVMIIPEYNGSIPGILKLVIDATDYVQAWRGKKAMLCGIATGRAGNLRGMDHMTNILHYLQVDVHPYKLPISSIMTLMTDGVLTDSVTLDLIKGQVDAFLAF